MSDDPAKVYTKELIQGYNQWFWAQAGKFEERLTLCFWLGLIFGILATITAAFPKDLLPEGAAQATLGWLVVLFTTLSTLFNATLAPRYKILMEMRDTGRIRLDELKQLNEIQGFSEEDREKIREVINKIAQIEVDFGGAGKTGDGGKG